MHFRRLGSLRSIGAPTADSPLLCYARGPRSRLPMRISR
jgi:hypothetical protein